MRIASLTTGLLISVASVMPASAEVKAPTPGADAPLLGDKASYPLLRYDYAPSPDGKAFTLIYSDLVATVNACNAKPVPGWHGGGGIHLCAPSSGCHVGSWRGLSC